MTITTLPTRNPADLGAALYDARTPNANELAAVNVEKIKDRVIEVATEIGLSSGATAGSINEMRTAFTSGAYSSILRRIGSSYGSQRIGGGLGAPTVANDSTEGYLPGSWWVQVQGVDNPATLAFFLCIDATAGAAVWVRMPIASDADPSEAGTASPGTSPDFARADHVHPNDPRPLLSLLAMQFSRASEASAAVARPFASVPLSWVSADVVRRDEDGFLLIESAPTLVAIAARDFAGAGWTGGTATRTAGAADGPDGAALAATRFQNTSAQYGSYSTVGVGPNAAAVWVRRLTGAYGGPCQGLLGPSPYSVKNVTITEYWERFELATSAAAADVWNPFDARATQAPMIAQALDLYADLAQVERGRYSTSSVRSGARDRDVAQWAPTEVPRALRAGMSRWSVRPIWSTSALVSGDVRVIASFGGSSDGLRVRHTGTDVRVEAVVGGVVKASSAAVSWTSQFLGPVTVEIDVDPVAGVIAVNGVTGAVGTAWEWPAGFFRLGGVWGGASEFDGGVALPEGSV